MRASFQTSSVGVVPALASGVRGEADDEEVLKPGSVELAPGCVDVSVPAQGEKEAVGVVPSVRLLVGVKSALGLGAANSREGEEKQDNEPGESEQTKR
jgi:hypothetical protein